MMSEPDIRIGDLSIWVLGRPFSQATNFYDENWLDIRATVRRGQSSVTCEGMILMTSDFARFRDELAVLYETTSREATLSSYEPNVKVTLSAGTLGHIGIQIEITPDQMSEYHRFEDGFDQTYLAPLAAACDEIIDRFPVMGKPER